MIQNYQNPTGGSAELAVPIKYGKLKGLRDKGVLVAGTWYRIIDYSCYTSQENTQSAGNQFDIIVRADDASHLNENAFAAHHEGDKHFVGCKLEAWELKYCIDNDNVRFPWANKDKGTGVIFYMKDEWNNECPYDFKNIMFKRYMVGEDLSGDRQFEQKYLYPVTKKEGPASLKNIDKYIYAYTFSSDAGADEQTDYSLDGMKNRVFGNIIECRSYGKLRDNVFYGEMCFNNKLYDCHGNSFDKHCYSNLLSSCYDNSFANFCFMNSLGSECHSNSYGSNNCHNYIGNNCYGNSFISFKKNYLGNDCCINVFGNNINNSFGNNCQNNKFKGYIRNCTVFDGVKYCNVTGGSNADEYLQNAQILNGTAGESEEEMLTIDFELNRKIIQVAGKMNDGTLEIFNPADLAVQ